MQRSCVAGVCQLLRGQFAAPALWQPCWGVAAAPHMSRTCSYDTWANAPKPRHHTPDPCQYAGLYVRGKSHTRKPGIKKPALHQWHFCASNYDGSVLPRGDILPPFAPLASMFKDYSKRYHQLKPDKRNIRNKFWRAWMKNMRLRHLKWKADWEQQAAAERKAKAKWDRREQRLLREQAWAQFQQQQLALLQRQLEQQQHEQH